MWLGSTFDTRTLTVVVVYPIYRDVLNTIQKVHSVTKPIRNVRIAFLILGLEEDGIRHL